MSETFDKFDPKDWSDKFDPNDWPDYFDPTIHSNQRPNVYGLTNPVDIVSFGIGYDGGYCEGYGWGATEINADHHPSWLNKDAYDMGYETGLYDGCQDS